MKPLGEQFIDALGYKGKSPDRYRDFTLIVLVGFAVLYGEVFAMGRH